MSKQVVFGEFTKPQLCHRPTDRLLARVGQGGYCAEAKLDGIRAQVHAGPEAGVVFSRLGNTMPEMGFLACTPVEMVVDAELVVVHPHACDCEGLEAKVGSHTVEHFRASHPWALGLAVFDVLYYGGEDVSKEPLSTRQLLVEDAVQQWKGALLADVRVVTWLPVENAFQLAVEMGAEGVVYKKLNGQYRPGSRCMDWVKHKVTETVSVVIVGADELPTEYRVRPGEVDPQTGEVSVDGDHSSSWKAGNRGLAYGCWDQMTEEFVRLGSLGVTGDPGQMQECVGLVADVKVWSVYSNGCLRHPVWLGWRSDVDSHDVTLESILEEGANGQA